MTVVKHSIVDNIALIEISNPPVNAISAAVRIELLQVIEILALDNSLKAIVITAPENIWLAERDNGEWTKLSYKKALKNINSISQYIIDNGLNQKKPIMILSGNSINHGLLNVAGLFCGVPVAPISVAYSLMSSDYAKLKHCFELVDPGLIFVEDGVMFERALENLPLDNIKVVCTKNPVLKYNMDLFKNLLCIAPNNEIEKTYNAVTPSYIAKYLFTSGSTGMPKGVINTQKMLCVNMQQGHQVRPQEFGESIIVDWLPWNHTMGGNLSLNGIFWNGGTMYIDNGKPTPSLFLNTIKNLKPASGRLEQIGSISYVIRGFEIRQRSM